MDKHFVFDVRQIDGRFSFHSEGCGFHTFEVLGFLDWKKEDILAQIRGEVKPDIVERKVIIPAEEGSDHA